MDKSEAELASFRQEFNAYAAANKRGDVESLQAEVREMRGPYPAEQRQRYVSILMRMISEWEEHHPEDAPDDGDR